VLNTDFSYDLTEGTLSRYIVEGDGYSRDIYYSYDGFGRTSSVTRSLTEFDGTGSIGQNIAYGYIQTSDPDDGTITYNRIGSVTNEYTVTADDETTTVASETFTYTYDASGNITEIKNNGSTLFRYHYDLLDQLTREDNAQSVRTYVYEYDNAGNIKSKKTYGYTTSATVSTTLYSTQTYGYGSGISGDILTSLNGSSITYDGTLSPLNYVLSGDDCALTWTQGRRLSHIISDDGSREYSYTYNADGIRTSKTVNGVEHIYHLSGTRILDEEWVSGSTRNLLIYIYDASGQPIGINYLKCVGNTVTKEAYLLGTNIQGDITCIYDTAGNRVVTYTYDAWGKILSVTGTAANTIGRYNPFRYRGYYYDNETGFYYLNSRYYDPGVGRFINADGYINANGDLIGFNMFAYCSNNPVNRRDALGTSWSEKWTSIKESVTEKWKEIVDDGVHSLIDVLFPGAKIVRNIHYNRNVFNDPERAKEKGVELGESESKFHQNNCLNGEDNIKKVDKGWFSNEVVLYGNGEINNTPEDVGTFNVYYGDCKFLNFTVHAIYDVLPYMIWGNSYDDSTTIIDRIRMGIK